MGKDTTLFSPKTGSTKHEASVVGTTVLVENKDETTTAHLVNFVPSKDVTRLPVFTRKELAAALVEHDKRQKARTKIRRWIIFLGLVASVALVLSIGPVLYRAYKAWRASTLAIQGEKLVKSNRVEDAIPPIRSAFLLSPDNPEVLRAMAQALSALGAPGAMTYWNWVIHGRGVTEDDRRAAAECAMQNGLFNEASDIIRDLVVRDGRDARNQFLAARWSDQRATQDQTMFFATRAVNDDPAYKPAVLFLAVHELANPYLHQEGVNTLFHLAGDDDAASLGALHRLALDPSLTPAEVDRLIARLRSHPHAGEYERIAALALEIKRHPDQRDALLDQAMAAHHNATPADVALFAEWLNSHSQASRVLQLVSRERALSSKPIFAAYIDALAVLNRWSELKTLLTSAVVPLEAPFVEVFLSRCATEMGDDQAADLYWQNAVAAAAGNPALSFYLAGYAEKLGQNDRASAIYRNLTQDPVVSRIAYQGLQRVLSGKDTRTLRDLLDEMASRWPADQEMASQDIYLNLLLNEHVPDMHRRAVALFADDSYSIAHRTDLALACLRLNDPAGAFQAYSLASIDWNTVPVSDLVIYAATLRTNGRVKAAHQLLASVNRHTLRPEVRDLIKDIP
jgi:tetratricopeptide (TPR) repeat protein